jgi:hypothetical protein
LDKGFLLGQDIVLGLADVSGMIGSEARWALCARPLPNDAFSPAISQSMTTKPASGNLDGRHDLLVERLQECQLRLLRSPGDKCQFE